jgi:hypothetical protein
MTDSYIIEIRPKAVGVTVQAGIVVRDGHHFRFCAATGAFSSLEGQLFKSPKAAESAVLDLVVNKSMRGRVDGIDVAHEREFRGSAEEIWTRSGI